jgi:hypothetical protein
MKFLISFLFIANICFCQKTIIGKVVNSTGEEIPFATVQLIIKDKVIEYTATDENGYFEINYNPTTSANTLLKVTHMSFVSKNWELNTLDLKDKIVLSLEEKTETLKEVTVQNKLSYAKVKGDTLSYNLKALTTGNEDKLVDVLKKLPGIDINSDGKIISQGKVINDLLVNGKKMFGDNHKIATENINAEMLKGIDLLSNFENFAAIKDVEGSNKTALNINIKEEYLGKITGNLEVLGAHDKRYQANSNLFKFNQKLNLSAILNVNNTGYQPISMKEYFSMNRSVRQELRNNDGQSNSLDTNEIPKFLLSDNNVNSKSNEFIALDFAFQSSNKLSMNGFSIVSRLKTNEISRTFKTFFDSNSTNNVVEFFSSNNDLLYNQTKLNIDYKSNDNSLVNYTLLFDPNTINTDTNLENNISNNQNSINEYFDKVNFKFGHQLSWINKIAKNKLLSFNLFQEFNKNQNDIRLDANYNLFNTGNRISQNITEKNNDYGFYTKLTVKHHNHIFKWNIGYIVENSTFNTRNTISSNQINFDSNYATSDVVIQKNQGKLNYKVKSEWRNYFLKFKTEAENTSFILPTLQLKYNFSEIHHIMANFSKIIDFYSSSNLNENPFFENFRNYYTRSTINFSTPVVQNIYAVNYFKFDLYNGVVIMANSSYTQFGNRLSNNTTNAGNYIQIQQINTENQYSWNNVFSFETRISKIKNKFKLTLNHINSNFNNQINSQFNIQKTEFTSLRTSLISIFKNELFNYEFGLNYSQQNNNLTLFNNHDKIVQLNPFLSFNGNLKNKFTYFIDHSFEKFITKIETTNFYNLSFKLNYKTNKMKFWIEGNNILNINNAQVLKFTSKNNFTSTEVINRLAGYIGLGVGFNIK